MSEPKYKRVLLKISGEALAGDAHRGLDFDVIGGVCDVIRQCVERGVQVGVVVGGGNFWRGLKDGGGRMERTRADHMGMLATVINALAVADRLEQRGVEVRVQTAIEMNKIAEPYIRSKAIRHLEKGRVVIFGCGTGNPYFSTDTGAVLRAAEINADAILLAKNIDGVYSADPAKDPNAVKYDTITYDEVLAKHLAVMDTTATSLSMDNHIPVLVFALKDPENILRVVMGEKIAPRRHRITFVFFRQKSPIARAAGRRFSFPNHLHHIPAAEMEKRIMADLKQFERKMEKTLEVLASDFGAVRAGRANAQVLDRIEVEYYGTPTPINQVGTISSPDPRTLVIQPWDGSLLKPIEKAIQVSDLGINPQNDGRVIRLVFPQLTEERRKELAKQVKKYGEDAKVAIRNVRRDAVDFVKKAQKKGETDRGRPEEGRKGHPGPDRQVCQEGRRDVRQEG